MMAVFQILTKQKRDTFKYAPFIEELKDPLHCINAIQKEIRTNGLSINTLRTSSLKTKELLTVGNERMRKLGTEINHYIKVELSKMVDQTKH